MAQLAHRGASRPACGSIIVIATHPRQVDADPLMRPAIRPSASGTTRWAGGLVPDFDRANPRASEGSAEHFDIPAWSTRNDMSRPSASCSAAADRDVSTASAHRARTRPPSAFAKEALVANAIGADDRWALAGGISGHNRRRPGGDRSRAIRREALGRARVRQAHARELIRSARRADLIHGRARAAHPHEVMAAMAPSVAPGRPLRGETARRPCEASNIDRQGSPRTVPQSNRDRADRAKKHPARSRLTAARDRFSTRSSPAPERPQEYVGTRVDACAAAETSRLSVRFAQRAHRAADPSAYRAGSSEPVPEGLGIAGFEIDRQRLARSAATVLRAQGHAFAVV